MFLELSIPGCLFFFYCMPSMDSLIYLIKPSSLSSTDSITSFSPSALKTQMLADPIYSFGPPEPWTVWNRTHLPPQNKSCIPSSTIHLSERNPRSPRHSQLNLGSMLQGPSLPHYSQSFPTSWLFYHRKPSPLFPLHFSYQCLGSSCAAHF